MDPDSPSPKISLLLELTSRCNARCSYCYNPARRTDELDTSKVLALIDKAVHEIAPYHMSFSGGEPLLRPDLPKLVRHAKEKALKVTVVTNGLLLNKARTTELLESGVDLFQVTLLAADRALHDRLEGGPFFERVVSSIAELVNAGAQVATSFVACKDNIADFARTLELNALLRVRRVQFCRFNPGGIGLAGWRSLLPSPDDVERALTSASSVAVKYGISVFASVPLMPCLVNLDGLEGIYPGYCAVGDLEHRMFALDPLGNLKVCPHSAITLGNAFKTPIPEMLRGRAYEEFVRSTPAFCVDCPHVAVCRGGCRSAGHLCFGSLREEDPFLALWKDRALAIKSRPDFSGRPVGRRACAV